MPDFEHTMPFADLKAAYIKAVNGEVICKRMGNQARINEFVSAWRTKSSFYGPSSEQMVEWLRQGYRPEGLTLDPPITPVRKRRRLQFSEEGELQLDLAWSGHDTPFLQWTTRESRPGMRVSVYTNFQAGTNVKVVQDYYQFVLRALVALESAGIDLEIWITSDSRDVFQGDYSSTLVSHVQVKKEGEQTDYLGWSPMISPGGYRHLKFLDYVLASDALGKTITAGLGRAKDMTHSWRVTFEPNERVLTFRCPWHPNDFPAQEMEIQMREVLSVSRSAV